jgi:hypothetical protein
MLVLIELIKPGMVGGTEQRSAKPARQFYTTNESRGSFKTKAAKTHNPVGITVTTMG